MKVFESLRNTDGTWILSYTENDVIKEHTSTNINDIKLKCIEYNFHLDFTGAFNVGNQ